LILRTAGSIANIIDILGKTINTISELRNQWQDADLAVLIFKTQLTALQAALTKIKKWTDTNFKTSASSACDGFRPFASDSH